MPKVELLLHNIRSVYNVAAIFRTAECLGVEKIYLSGYTPAPQDRFGRWRNDFHKVALGTDRIISCEQIPNVHNFMVEQKQLGKAVVGLEQHSLAIPLRTYTPQSPLILAPGTETTGLGPEIIDGCDMIVQIEQRGTKESLNVHSATAIALWHLI